MKAFVLSSLRGPLSASLAVAGLLLTGCQDQAASPPQPKAPPLTTTVIYPPGFRVLDSAYAESIMRPGVRLDTVQFEKHVAKKQPASAYLPPVDTRISSKRDTTSQPRLFWRATPQL